MFFLTFKIPKRKECMERNLAFVFHANTNKSLLFSLSHWFGCLHHWAKDFMFCVSSSWANWSIR
jgi:hypothetical protein